MPFEGSGARGVDNTQIACKVGILPWPQNHLVEWFRCQMYGESLEVAVVVMGWCCAGVLLRFKLYSSMGYRENLIKYVILPLNVNARMGPLTTSST